MVKLTVSVCTMCSLSADCSLTCAEHRFMCRSSFYSISQRLIRLMINKSGIYTRCWILFFQEINAQNQRSHQLCVGNMQHIDHILRLIEAHQIDALLVCLLEAAETIVAVSSVYVRISHVGDVIHIIACRAVAGFRVAILDVIKLVTFTSVTIGDVIGQGAWLSSCVGRHVTVRSPLTLVKYWWSFVALSVYLFYVVGISPPRSTFQKLTDEEAVVFLRLSAILMNW